MTVPGLPCEVPAVAELSEPEDGEVVADDPSVVDEASDGIVVETGTKLP